jgi:hypothetical protein
MEYHYTVTVDPADRPAAAALSVVSDIMATGNRGLCAQSDRQPFECISTCSRRLLFAPRLMLERGLQFTARRSLKHDARSAAPLSLRGFICESRMKPA